MPENKNQHIVPQHYLRFFSKERDDASNKNEIKTICRYNLKKAVRQRASIKKTCIDNYFYGKEEESIEQKLRDIENIQAPILSRLISSQYLDDFNLDKNFHLLAFVIFLHSRTKSARTLVSKVIDGYFTEDFRMFCKNKHKDSIEEIDEEEIN